MPATARSSPAPSLLITGSGCPSCALFGSSMTVACVRDSHPHSRHRVERRTWLVALLVSGAIAALFAAAIPTRVRVVLQGPAPGQDRHQGRHGERLGLPAAPPRWPSPPTTRPSPSPTATTSPRSAQRGPDGDPQELPAQPAACTSRRGSRTPSPASTTGATRSLQRGAAPPRGLVLLPGLASTAARTHQFNGPLNDNWQATDVTDSAPGLAPCGQQRNFNIDTELRVNGYSTSGSFMAMDSTDGDINTTYHMAWQQCPPK